MVKKLRNCKKKIIKYFYKGWSGAKTGFFISFSENGKIQGIYLFLNYYFRASSVS